METSAKATSFPNWARLKRDKGNYPAWQRHIFDVLQASGCEQAITEAFARLVYETDDSSSSGDDSDDFHQGFSRLGLGKHSSQPSPTASQDDQYERAQRIYASFQKAGKKGMQRKKREKERRKKEKKFEEK